MRLASVTTFLVLASVVRADPTPADATWPGHDDPVLDLCFSPDGKRLASVGDDGKLKLWDVATHKELGNLADLIENQNRVRFTPDGKSLLTLGRDDTLARLNARTGRPEKAVPLHSVPGGTAAFDVSPDGKTLAVVGRGSLRILATADGAEIRSLEVHANYGINAVAFSPDGKFVATTATDHKADVIDWDAGKIAHEFALPLNGVAITFSHDGKTLFAASSDSTIQSFDLATEQAKTLIDQKVAVKQLAPTPAGDAVYVGGTGRTPWRVRLPGGEVDETPLDGGGWNKAIAVSPDGRRVAGGANDGSIWLWTIAK